MSEKEIEFIADKAIIEKIGADNLELVSRIEIGEDYCIMVSV